MYTLSKESLKTLEAFIEKIPDSIIRARIEKWLGEVKPTMRITSEAMEEFVNFSTHLPQELQNFPQSFSMAVKNTPQIEEDDKVNVEVEKDKGEPVDLNKIAADSIKGVKVQEGTENKEEPLHKLVTKETAKKATVKKSVSKKKK